nr:hypothetical protein CFP56_69775 [Quercus suber]
MRLLVHDLLRRRREIPQNARNWKSKNLFSRDYAIGFTESILIVSSCVLKSIDWIFIDKGMINVIKNQQKILNSTSNLQFTILSSSTEPI